MTYFIDIHGEYELFIKLLQKIKFNTNDFLLSLGDMIDKGPNSLVVVRFFMVHNNTKSLMGYHEYELLNYIIII